jgi:hypothetical protein
MPLYMVFDVESVGLHGEGYAVGFVVVDRDGQEIITACYHCDPNHAGGDADGRKWVQENAPTPSVGLRRTPFDVRREFWDAWMDAKAHGALLFADCAWPVEARFLAACVDDDREARYWAGPFPLHEIATMRLAAGLDPLATVERLPSELPVHDPQADARQSARLLIEALDRLVIAEI